MLASIVMEAKHAGLPQVVFPRGGLVEQVSHLATGYLCADATTAELVKGIRWFLDSPERLAAAREACLAAAADPESPHRTERHRDVWRKVFGLEPPDRPCGV